MGVCERDFGACQSLGRGGTVTPIGAENSSPCVGPDTFDQKGDQASGTRNPRGADGSVIVVLSNVGLLINIRNRVYGNGQSAHDKEEPAFTHSELLSVAAQASGRDGSRRVLALIVVSVRMRTRVPFSRLMLLRIYVVWLVYGQIISPESQAAPAGNGSQLYAHDPPLPQHKKWLPDVQASAAGK